MGYKMIYFLLKLSLIMTWFLAVSISCAQELIDRGIGMVILPGGDFMHGVIHAKSAFKSDTLATLYQWEYTFYPSHQKMRAFLVGFHKYDNWGLPIISINKDTSWAKVLIQSVDLKIKFEGWLNLKIPGTAIRVWAEYLPTCKYMVLREKPPIHFYSKPNHNSILKIKVHQYLNRDEYSYILRPITRQGRWLLVELETPYFPCPTTTEKFEKLFGAKPRIIRVWIQYLDDRGRPLVTAPMLC